MRDTAGPVVSSSAKSGCTRRARSANSFTRANVLRHVLTESALRVAAKGVRLRVSSVSPITNRGFGVVHVACGGLHGGSGQAVRSASVGDSRAARSAGSSRRWRR